MKSTIFFAVAILAYCALLVACTYDARIVNGSKEPIPTAPMATLVQQQDGTTAINPQMGPPPAEGWDQRPPSPGFPWLATLLGVAGALIPGIGIAGTLLARLRAAMAALVVTVDAIEAAPPSAGKPIKEAAKKAKNKVLNDMVAERT